MKRGILILFAIGCGGSAKTDEGHYESIFPDDPNSPETATASGDWSCLGEAPAMAEREPGRVKYVVPVVDFYSQPGQVLIVPDLQVSVCSDADCSSELARCTGADPCYDLAVDGSPAVVLTFDLPFAYDGILRFTAPGYVDLDYVLGGPMVGAPDGSMTVTGQAVYMLSVTAMERFYSDLGQSAVDRARGVLMVTALNCLGERAADLQLLQVAGDFAGSSAYSLSLSNILTPDSTRTDPRGVTGFIDMQPGAFTVGVSVGGEEYARSSVRVRANAFTLTQLRSGLGLWGQ
jgi:hypothetical protein